MRGLIRCCLFLCFPVLLWAQDGVQVKRERVFTGSGLYGFMNGVWSVKRAVRSTGDRWTEGKVSGKRGI